jgi:hypothetical protein
MDTRHNGHGSFTTSISSVLLSIKNEDILVTPDLQIAIEVGQVSQLVVYIGPLQMILVISGNPSPRWRKTRWSRMTHKVFHTATSEVEDIGSTSRILEVSLILSVAQDGRWD